MDQEEIGGLVVKAFYAVYNELGHGFLEKNYENAFAYELRRVGLCVQQQAPITVFYKGQPISEYFADILVEGCIICELKSGPTLSEAHERQLLNYLKAKNIDLGFLLNFGLKPQTKRKVFANW